MLRKTTAEIISQVTDITEKLSNEEYASPVALLHGSSIGKHVRHIIEFYDCLLRGYETGTVDYDAREHNALLENDKALAVKTLQEINEKTTYCTEKPLMLSVNFSDQSEKANFISSSYERELIYNIEHVVHHAAIIKIALKNSFPHVIVPENFGVAYSTVRFNKKQQEEETLHIQ
ncbi:MAG TPA: DinB family protein [Bacteroidia bacterium]|nr:DinB family protein [Bacteroidia bacterium]